MKVFIIPSWYPSSSNPIYGIFNKEQAQLMAENRPGWKVGVSTWGQGDEPFLLRARDPKSFVKVFRKYDDYKTKVEENLTEYFSSAFTWSVKFKQGNIRGIIEANDRNLNQFIYDFGKPDVISAQASYPAAIIAEALSRKYQIPYTVTLRMSPFPFSEYLTKSGGIKSIIGDPLKNSDLLIATSNSLKERVKSLGLENVQTLNNPVDTTFFQPSSETQSQELTALAVGRIEEQKGFDILLESLATIPELKLRVGGKGDLLSSYVRLAEKLGVENRVEWLGELTREQVRVEMQACSFYILSSRHETYGNVILEAMACGKPVVATKCGGPIELVTEETGFLCDISVSDLTQKIELMKSSLKTFDSVEIRKHVKNHYSPDVWLKRLEQLFKSIE